MKNFTSLRLLFCSMLLAFTAGTALADDVSDELTSGSDCFGVTSTTYTTATYTGASGAVYSAQMAGQNSSIQLRSNNSNSGIVTTTSGGKRVKSISIEWEGHTASARVLDVYGSNTAYTAPSQLYSSSTQGTKIGSFKCSDGNTTLTISGDYAYIGVRSNSGALYVSKLTIVWEQEDASDTRTATTVAFGESAYTTTFGTSVTVSATVSDDESNPISGAVVKYSSSDESVATVGENDGVVITQGTGTANIIATYEGNEEYKGSEATVPLTVTYVYEHAGTVDDPFTVTEAIEKAKEIGTTANGPYYTKGVITGTPSVDLSYYNANYDIAQVDDATKTITIYRGKYLNNTNFSATDEIQDGDTVVITGNLVNYSGTTPEYAQGNYIVSLSRPGTVVLTPPTFSVESGTYEEPQSVTLSADEGLYILYTTDGTDPSWADSNGEIYTDPISVTTGVTIKAIAVNDDEVESSVSSKTYVIKPAAPTLTEGGSYAGSVDVEMTASATILYTTDGTVPSLENEASEIYDGTAVTLTTTTTVKAVAVDDYDNVSDVVSQTYTITDANTVIATYTFTDTNWTSEQGYPSRTVVSSWAVDNVVIGGDKGTGSNGPTYYTTNGGNLRTYNNSRFVVASTDGTPITSITMVCSNTTYAKVTLPEGQPGELSLDGSTYTWVPSASEKVVSVTFSGSGTSYISSITVITNNSETIGGSVSISDAGYGTYYTEQPFEVPAGMTAGIITTAGEVDADGISILTLEWKYEADSIVPAATPLIIKGAAGEYTYICKGTTAATPETNLLKGSAVATTTTGDAGDKFFMLSYGKDDKADVLGFFYGAADGAAFESAAGKCWLAVPSTTGVSGFVFFFDDITTALQNVATEATNGQAIYDLQGRRVSQATKGIYIIGGKKVMVK